MFPALTFFDKLPALFNSISQANIPTKFTYRFLMELGFKSSQEREFLPLLKFLNFLTHSGVPTDFYKNLRSSKTLAITLQKAIKDSYAPIFAMEPNAPLIQKADLYACFKQLTSVSAVEVERALETFLALCSLADFGQIPDPASVVGQKTPRSVRLNITLPTTTDEKVYEVLFKHLKDLVTR